MLASDTSTAAATSPIAQQTVCGLVKPIQKHCQHLMSCSRALLARWLAACTEPAASQCPIICRHWLCGILLLALMPFVLWLHCTRRRYCQTQLLGCLHYHSRSCTRTFEPKRRKQKHHNCCCWARKLGTSAASSSTCHKCIVTYGYGYPDLLDAFGFGLNLRGCTLAHWLHCK